MIYKYIYNTFAYIYNTIYVHQLNIKFLVPLFLLLSIHISYNFVMVFLLSRTYFDFVICNFASRSTVHIYIDLFEQWSYFELKKNYFKGQCIKNFLLKVMINWLAIFFLLVIIKISNKKLQFFKIKKFGHGFIFPKFLCFPEKKSFII